MGGGRVFIKYEYCRFSINYRHHIKIIITVYAIKNNKHQKSLCMCTRILVQVLCLFIPVVWEHTRTVLAKKLGEPMTVRARPDQWSVDHWSPHSSPLACANVRKCEPFDLEQIYTGTFQVRTLTCLENCLLLTVVCSIDDHYTFEQNIHITVLSYTVLVIMRDALIKMCTSH